VKILVLGNSQAGALKRSHDHRAAAFAAAGIALHFHVIPGGAGPDVTVIDDMIVVGAVSPTHPPYVSPAGTDRMPISSFDAILICALGYTDGGFAFRNPIPVAGALAEFRPRAGALARPLVSDTCFAAMAGALLDAQPGMAAWRAVAKAFSGPVFLQPFPRLSEAVATHADWTVGQWYEDAIGMHRFLETVKDDYLARVAAETGTQLLPYPQPERADMFTPAALMRPVDGVHQADLYGDMVLDALIAAI
jgi:hypothetical protein